MMAATLCSCREGVLVHVYAYFVIFFWFGLPTFLVYVVFEDLIVFYFSFPRPFRSIDDLMDSYMLQVTRPKIEIADTINVISEGWSAITQIVILEPCKLCPSPRKTCELGRPFCCLNSLDDQTPTN